MMTSPKKRRKPAIGEVLIIVVITIIVVLSCIIFITRATPQDELSIREDGTGPETGQGNESISGLEHGDNPELGEGNNTPVVEPASASPADTISIVDMVSANPGFPQLVSELNEEASDHNAAGISLVVYDGFMGLFYTYQYGYADIAAGRPVDIDTKIRIASLSKLVVAICAMKLVETNRLDLDEDISDYLGYQVRSPHYPQIPITTRMLLQHTSSIHDSTAINDSIMGNTQVSTQSLLGQGSSYMTVRPGSTFIYTNFGYSVLGAVIEFIADMKLDAFAREVLFTPMDIDAAFQAVNLNDSTNLAILYDSGHGIVRSLEAQISNNRSGDIGQDQHLAQGSLLISAFDYAKILAMLGNGGVFIGNRILSSESVREIHQADVAGPGFMHGLSTRFSHGGNNELDEANVSITIGDDEVDSLVVQSDERDDTEIWRYVTINGAAGPSDGFFWHTGSAHGVFAQYIYIAGSGTNEGVSEEYSSRGVVVITTGASTGRMENGMINVCNHLSEIAWRGLGFNEIDQ